MKKYELLGYFRDRIPPGKAVNYRWHPYEHDTLFYCINATAWPALDNLMWDRLGLDYWVRDDISRIIEAQLVTLFMH